MEADRHVPNVRAALGVASALGVSVEELFGDAAPTEVVEAVLGAVPTRGTVTTARVGDRLVMTPLRHGTETLESWAVADAITDGRSLMELPGASQDGIVIAGCDPMLGLLGGLLARAGDRLVVAHASTGRAIEALASGRVHGVMVHAATGELPPAPVPVRRWHVTRWQVGLASSARSGVPSMETLVERRWKVVQRDAGAGSQRAFERALATVGAAPSMVPGPIAEGHVDVASRLAVGGGRVGVTMEAAARAFDLDFAPLEEHAVELWIDDRWAALPAVGRLVELLDHPALAQRLGALGGYDLEGAGASIGAGSTRHPS